MESGFGDRAGGAGVAVDAIEALTEGLDGLSGRELAARLQDLERVMRRCEAAVVSVLDAADRRGVYSVDGHRSIRGWAGGTVRWSPGETLARCRTVQLLRDVPAVGEQLAGGLVGVAQVRELARVRANPRCGEQLAAAVPKLLEWAVSVPFVEFRQLTQRWESLRDVDGAHRGHEAAHAGRRVATSTLDDTTHVVAQFGVVQGAAIGEILRRFEQAEFDAEWAELKARLGDQASAGDMPRTAGQRRADAMHAIFLAAASTPAGAQAPKPVVNLVVTAEQFEAHLQATLTDQPVEPPDAENLFARCETDAGHAVDPADAVAAAIVGHVRRVVMNSTGVVIAMGRLQRLFTGSTRIAALLQGHRCLWPGCGRDFRTQIDHSTDWHQHGLTDPRNAGPLCPHHNRFKTRGYHIARDSFGCWHTYRPDGTEIEAA
jgi:hypothetical protein